MQLSIYIDILLNFSCIKLITIILKISTFLSVVKYALHTLNMELITVKKCETIIKNMTIFVKYNNIKYFTYLEYYITIMTDIFNKNIIYIVLKLIYTI